MSAAGQQRLSRRHALSGMAAGAALMLASRPPAVGGGAAIEKAIADIVRDRNALISNRVSIELPYTFEFGLSVPLGIAVESPMTEDDHVRRVDVLAENNPLPEVVSLFFAPGNGPARIATRFRLGKGSHRVWALAELSDGRVLAASAEIIAAKDGCGGDSGIQPGEAEPQPVPRVNVPAQAGRGEIFDVPCMISHRMETGFRTDTAGNPLPRRIINRMECRYAGRTVFAADLAPAIAPNAYLKFPIRALETGDVAFTWYEDGGATYRTTRHIEVD